MRNYFVYILYSLAIDGYYIGYTGDVLSERLRKHNTNHKGYTGRTNDWVYVYKECFETSAEAYARERYIKSRKSKKYIGELISSQNV